MKNVQVVLGLKMVQFSWKNIDESPSCDRNSVDDGEMWCEGNACDMTKTADGIKQLLLPWLMMLIKMKLVVVKMLWLPIMYLIKYILKKGNLLHMQKNFCMGKICTCKICPCKGAHANVEALTCPQRSQGVDTLVDNMVVLRHKDSCPSNLMWC